MKIEKLPVQKDASKAILSIIKKLDEVIDHINGDVKIFPEVGDVLFRLNSRGQIIEQQWHNTEKQKAVRDFGGIYRTKEEAEEAKQKIIKAVRGDN